MAVLKYLIFSCNVTSTIAPEPIKRNNWEAKLFWMIKLYYSELCHTKFCRFMGLVVCFTNKPLFFPVSINCTFSVPQLVYRSMYKILDISHTTENYENRGIFFNSFAMEHIWLDTRALWFGQPSLAFVRIGKKKVQIIDFLGEDDVAVFPSYMCFKRIRSWMASMPHRLTKFLHTLR